MLHSFLTDNRDELVKRGRDKVASRAAPKSDPGRTGRPSRAPGRRPCTARHRGSVRWPAARKGCVEAVRPAEDAWKWSRLGLSVRRNGVEASGGKLCVRDLPGHGCIFTIDLPVAAPLNH